MSKITSLTENTTPVGTDLVAMVDDPSGTPLTQKATLQNIRAGGALFAWITNDSALQTKAFTDGVAAAWDETANGSGSVGTGLTADAANSRIQINQDGYYRVSANVALSLSAVGNESASVELRYNGTRIPASQQSDGLVVNADATDGLLNATINYAFSGILDTNGTTGQYVEIWVTTLNGSNPTLASFHWQLNVQLEANT